MNTVFPVYSWQRRTLQSQYFESISMTPRFVVASDLLPFLAVEPDISQIERPVTGKDGLPFADRQIFYMPVID